MDAPTTSASAKEGASGPLPAPGWGDWSLGDLADALRAASEAVRPTTEVSWVGVYPPTCVDLLPVVEIAVESVDRLTELRGSVSEVAQVIVPIRGVRSFQAALETVLLHVWVQD